MTDDEPGPAMADVPLEWLETLAIYHSESRASPDATFARRVECAVKMRQMARESGRHLPSTAARILAELSLRRYGQSQPGGAPLPGEKGRLLRWRVFGSLADAQNLGNQQAAQKAVDVLLDASEPATIYYWRDGAWQILEHYEPAAQ